MVNSLTIRMRLFFKKIKVSWRFHFAHHPLCDNYRNQIFEINGIYLCQGCTLTYIGIFLGLISSLLLNLDLSIIEWLIIGLGILVFLFIIEFLNISNRKIKRLIRFVTGIGLGSFIWFLFSSTNFYVSLIAIIFTYLGYRVFKIIRSSQVKEDKCLSCSEFNKGKICSGLALEAQVNREYSEYATNLLQDKLKALAMAKYKNIVINEKKDSIKEK